MSAWKTVSVGDVFTATKGHGLSKDEIIENVEWNKDDNKDCSVTVKENRYLLAENTFFSPML